MFDPDRDFDPREVERMADLEDEYQLSPEDENGKKNGEIGAKNGKYHFSDVTTRLLNNSAVTPKRVARCLQNLCEAKWTDVENFVEQFETPVDKQSLIDYLGARNAEADPKIAAILDIVHRRHRRVIPNEDF